MEKNKKNEELQSRRQFFKKAAKGALPILGAIALANVPVMKINAMRCDCSGGCSRGCYGSCSGECKGSCKGLCTTSCQGGCSTSCYTGCGTTCGGSCRGGSSNW